MNSYRYGTWLQLIDFMNFRESLDNSVQRNTVRIERRLIEYTTEAHSRDVIHRVRNKFVFSIYFFENELIGNFVLNSSHAATIWT